jgi:hypothetical protein
MWPAIVGLFAFVLVMVLLGTLFLVPLVTIIVNAVVLYLVGIRALKEVNRGWLIEYCIGVIIGVIVVMLLGNAIPLLWKFTEWAVLAFIAAQLTHMLKAR